MTAAAGRAAGGQDGASLGEITPDALRETFPQWRIFRHAGRAWWATRGGMQHRTGPESLPRVVRAPDLASLAERLRLQEWLDDLDDEALAAVYRDIGLPWAAP